MLCSFPSRALHSWHFDARDHDTQIVVSGFEAMDTPSTSLLGPPGSHSIDRFDLASLLIPQDTEEARQRWGTQLNRLYPSSTIYFGVHDPDGSDDSGDSGDSGDPGDSDDSSDSDDSDDSNDSDDSSDSDDPGDLGDSGDSDDSDDLGDSDIYGGEWPSERRSAAYELFTRFHEVMRMCENERERARICSNHRLARAIVTPVHRLPEEILTEVFMSHRAIPYPCSRYHFGVCRRWHSLLQRIPAFWSILTIREWTDKDYVHSFLSRGKNEPLDVRIYTDDDPVAILNNRQPYEAISLVLKSAERLDSLTLKGSDNKMLGLLPAMLRNHLLGISASANRLTVLRILGDHYISILSQPSHPIIFSGLTYLSVSVSERHEPVNFLLHLLVIQRLSMTRVALVNYDANKPLPLVNTLIHLSLSHTSIQWMVGKEFKKRRTCDIYFPHQHHITHPTAAILPVCDHFTYHAQPLAGLRGFVIPPLQVLHLKNKNSDKPQNVMEIQRIQNFLLPQMPLVSLVLEVECHDQDLLGALRLLPSLTLLQMRLR